MRTSNIPRLSDTSPPAFIDSNRSFHMKTSMLLATLVATIGLAACERPTVVNNPPASPAVVPVPGPAGPQGETGRPGGSTVVVVPPAASAASQ